MARRTAGSGVPGALAVVAVAVIGVAAAVTVRGSHGRGTAVATTGPAVTITGTAVTTTGPAAPVGACRVSGRGLDVLPDPRCTPGATNPAVTQADIASTICATGWTSTVRPPESYTEPLKARQMAAYGEPPPISAYEEDHLIPLELGGSPTDPANLWPEPGASPNPKDDVESAARRAVCDGSMPLAEAQQAIASDWVSFGRRLGVARL